MKMNSLDNVIDRINVDKTRELYVQLECFSEESSASLNFQRNMFMRKEWIEECLAPMGIEIMKYQDIHVISINQPTQSVTYCGYYPVCLDNFEDMNFDTGTDEECTDLYRTVFGFEFSLEMIRDQTALFFWAELPWMYMPPIPRSRYENKAFLPEVN